MMPHRIDACARAWHKASLTHECAMPVFFLVIVAFFCVIAVQVGVAVRRDAAVLAAHGLARTLAALVWLFPLGPLWLQYGTPRLVFPLAPALALACYLPAIAAARRQLRVLEASGDERAAGAQATAVRVVGFGIAGILYVLVTLGMTMMGRAR
jgi:hypothetical protein